MHSDSGVDAAIDAATPLGTDAGIDPGTDGGIEMADAFVPPVDACAYGTWYADTDGDGFGNAATAIMACAQPVDAVSDATDCDDTRAGSHPGATEVCNGVDDNCVGGVDEDVQIMFYADCVRISRNVIARIARS